MRTLIAFWAAALAAPVLFAGAVSLKVSSIDTQPGVSRSVDIELAGDQGIGAMHVELAYDAAVLSVEAVDAGPAVQGASLKSNHDAPGRIVLSIATDKSLKGGGPLATVRFKVLGTGGQESALTLEKCKAWSDGEAEMLLPIETTNGKLRILRPEVANGVRRDPPKPVPWLPIGIGAGVLAVLILVVAMRGKKAPTGADCPHCGATVAAGSQFCPKCGKPPVAAGSCPKCGTPLQGDARFCARCGTPRS